MIEYIGTFGIRTDTVDFVYLIAYTVRQCMLWHTWPRPLNLSIFLALLGMIFDVAYVEVTTTKAPESTISDTDASRYVQWMLADINQSIQREANLKAIAFGIGVWTTVVRSITKRDLEVLYELPDAAESLGEVQKNLTTLAIDTGHRLREVFESKIAADHRKFLEEEIGVSQATISTGIANLEDSLKEWTTPVADERLHSIREAVGVA